MPSSHPFSTPERDQGLTLLPAGSSPSDLLREGFGQQNIPKTGDVHLSSLGISISGCLKYQNTAAMAQLEDTAVSMKMEPKGEGNYASTISSETGGQHKDQGLTLPPLIQSSDQWLFDADHSFNAGLLDDDLEALLGGDVGEEAIESCFRRTIAEDATDGDFRRDKSRVHTPRTHENHSSEPTTKRRKLTYQPSPSFVVQSTDSAVGSMSSLNRTVRRSKSAAQNLGPVPALSIPAEPVVYSPDSGYGPSIASHQGRQSNQLELTDNQLQTEEVAVGIASEERSPSSDGPLINATEDHEDDTINELSSDEHVPSKVPREAKNDDNRSNFYPDPNVPLPSIEKDDLPPAPKRVQLPAFQRTPYWLIPFIDNGNGKQNVADSDGHGKEKSCRAVADKSEKGCHSPATQNRSGTHLNHQYNTQNLHLLFTPSDHQAHNFLPPSIMATTAQPVKEITKANIFAAFLTLLEDHLSDHRISKLKSFDIPPSIRDTLNSLWDTIQDEKDKHGIFKTSLFKFALESLQVKLNNDSEDSPTSSSALDAPLEHQLKSIISIEEAKSIIRSNHEAYQKSLATLEATNKKLNNNIYAAENRTLRKQNHVLQAELVDSESRHWQSQYTKLLLLGNRPRCSFAISEAKTSNNQPQQNRDNVAPGLAPDLLMPNIQLQLNVHNHPIQNPFWMCCLADSINEAHQCLAINQHFISTSANWVAHKFCKGCSKPNSVNRLYISDAAAHVMGGLTVRTRPDILNSPNELPQMRKKSDRKSQTPRDMIMPSIPQTSAVRSHASVYTPTYHSFTSMKDVSNTPIMHYPDSSYSDVRASNGDGFSSSDTYADLYFQQTTLIPQIFDTGFSSNLTLPKPQIPVASPYPPSPHEPSMFARQIDPVQPIVTAATDLTSSAIPQRTSLSLPLPVASTSHVPIPATLSARTLSKNHEGFHVPKSTSNTLRIEAGNYRAWMGKQPVRPQLAASQCKQTEPIDLTTSYNEEGAEGSSVRNMRAKKCARYADLFGSDEEDEDDEGDAPQPISEITISGATPLIPGSDSASEFHPKPDNDGFEADLDADLNNYFDENEI